MKCHTRNHSFIICVLLLSCCGSEITEHGDGSVNRANNHRRWRGTSLYVEGGACLACYSINPNKVTYPVVIRTASAFEMLSRDRSKQLPCRCSGVLPSGFDMDIHIPGTYYERSTFALVTYFVRCMWGKAYWFGCQASPARLCTHFHTLLRVHGNLLHFVYFFYHPPPESHTGQISAQTGSKLIFLLCEGWGCTERLLASIVPMVLLEKLAISAYTNLETRYVSLVSVVTKRAFTYVKHGGGTSKLGCVLAMFLYAETCVWFFACLLAVCLLHSGGLDQA